jgi:hypothetical protein
MYIKKHKKFLGIFLRIVYLRCRRPATPGANMAADVPALAKETCDAEMDVEARNNCCGSRARQVEDIHNAIVRNVTQHKHANKLRVAQLL